MLTSEHKTDSAVDIGTDVEGCQLAYSKATDGRRDEVDEVVEGLTYCDVWVDRDCVVPGVKRILNVLWPEWFEGVKDAYDEQELPENITITPLTDGITNRLLLVTYTGVKTASNNSIPSASNAPFKLLIRIYGPSTHLLINRSRELHNMLTLASQRLVSPVYGRFNNGLVYGYMEGRVCTTQEMVTRGEQVARGIGRWHCVDISKNPHHKNGEETPQLFPTMRAWLRSIPEQYTSPGTQAAVSQYISRKGLAAELEYLQGLIESSSTQKKTATGMPVSNGEKRRFDVVFCHNDLLANNILFSDDSREHVDGTNDDVGVHFIDYEYACMSYRAFDIANHWCEFAGFECDYSQYPSPAFQHRFLQAYVSEILHQKTIRPDVPLPYPFSAASDTTTPHDSSASMEVAISTLLHDIHLFTLASHLFWALWALVQAEISDLEFGYCEYAVKRLKEYERCKERVGGGPSLALQ
ncbi:hypothetical protein HDU85_005040 [Gaertneriomyces sp. JEL0708]|nr:hypothetical protein HDU85_005040 [Gaertneriomyces sp. JEL0708]